MCVKPPTKSLAEMVTLVNQTLGKKVSYKHFCAVKNAFITDQTITYGQILEAFKKHPSISNTEVLRFFKREALVGPEALIEGQAIFRTHLITLIEALEDWTGRKMTDDNNPWGPLEYLDGYTISIENIAEFFATGEGKIAHILRNHLEAENN